ncbi:MAG TPA: ABC transporter ATP-binding protein [Vicinamibacterales bacterium]|nr:ABC transporter ATP-binding protein [Vicinamibacterales bacterium]HOQ58993.1 ABC transporter ATP-binding protein [Vicinamibacterales bacterium]HPK70377.1 ABC transporter ATP-binding protein [Vicinamibacterales bacterium]
MALALELERVTKRFGPTDAVRDVSYAVEPGEMFGLIGPDGAGKTTTIRLLCGLLRASSGSIRVLGQDPVRAHGAITRKVGYFSQKFSLYGDLSIDENIAFFAEIHGVADYRERRNRLLDMMQLTPFRGRLAERLSGGMKQKLALACTLVHEPEVILLDEPTTGVDPVSRREFWHLLSEFLSQGITIFMATPYLDEAERCSRVALMSQGRVLALDDPGSLRAAFPDDLVEMLAPRQDEAARIALLDPAVRDVQRFGERLHVRVPRGEGPGVTRRLGAACREAGIDVTGLRTVPASLEDVFIDRVVTTPDQGAA